MTRATLIKGEGTDFRFVHLWIETTSTRYNWLWQNLNGTRSGTNFTTRREAERNFLEQQNYYETLGFKVVELHG